MIRLPRVVTLRLDDATLSLIRGRIGDGYLLKNLSQFIREGIRLRLQQRDEYTGWQVHRSVGR